MDLAKLAQIDLSTLIPFDCGNSLRVTKDDGNFYVNAGVSLPEQPGEVFAVQGQVTFGDRVHYILIPFVFCEHLGGFDYKALIPPGWTVPYVILATPIKQTRIVPDLELRSNLD